MILGVLSDSHGCSDRTRRAVTLLRRLGAEALVHCGDIGSQEVVAELAGSRAWFVWGNTDWRDAALERFAETIGVTAPRDVPSKVTLGGKRIAVFHGHEPEFMALARLLQRGDLAGFQRQLQDVDYLLHGHTHRASSEQIGTIRIVNPGALQRAVTYTVATVDLALDRVTHWIIDDQADERDKPRRYEL